MIHRLFECLETAYLRSGPDSDIIKDLPRATVTMGLFQEPHILENYMKQLDMIEPPVFQPLPPDHPRVYVFTDGSCSKPDSGRTTERKATWALRRASPCSENSEPICSGVLPGRKQTAYRSELFAVLCALSFARQVTVFSDCKGVVRGFQKLNSVGWYESEWRSTPDVDLWRTGWALMQRHGVSLEIKWSASHRKASQAAGTQDLWEIVNNNLTDRDAAHHKHPWPAHVQPLFENLVQANQLDTQRKMAVTRYIRKIWDLHEDCDGE